MHSLGLKLWSINENYVEEAVRLFHIKLYQYIELYVVPESYDKFIYLWENLDIPYVIHAPHFRFGMNLAKKENIIKNLAMVEETIKFADKLNAKTIIFHPGIAGNIEDTVFHLNIINDNRIVIENKPYHALNDGLICNGSSIEDIQFIINNAKVGFCLDIGHAFCSANSRKIDPILYLKEFLKLNPDIYHLTDGDFFSIFDSHLHFGSGNFDIKKILEILPSNCSITIETIKNFNDNLSDFEEDINFLDETGMLLLKTDTSPHHSF